MDTAGEHVDREVVRELRMVMGSEFPALLDTFERDSEMRMGAMQQAIADGDSEALRRTAHSFKGSASNMGARQLADLCRMAEMLGRSGRVSGGAELLTGIRAEYRHVLHELRNL